MDSINILLTIICFFSITNGMSQSPRLEVRASGKSTYEVKKFVSTCLCSNQVSDMIPIGADLGTAKEVQAIVQIRDAVKFAKKCDGIYYYKLISEYWATPTFRDSGSYSFYHYLVILDSHLYIFKTNDSTNSKKFVSIRKKLVRELGVVKTDSIKKYLLLGYKEFR